MQGKQQQHLVVTWQMAPWANPSRRTFLKDNFRGRQGGFHLMCTITTDSGITWNLEKYIARHQRGDQIKFLTHSAPQHFLNRNHHTEVSFQTGRECNRLKAVGIEVTLIKLRLLQDARRSLRELRRLPKQASGFACIFATTEHQKPRLRKMVFLQQVTLEALFFILLSNIVLSTPDEKPGWKSNITLLVHFLSNSG